MVIYGLCLFYPLIFLQKVTEVDPKFQPIPGRDLSTHWSLWWSARPLYTWVIIFFIWHNYGNPLCFFCFIRNNKQLPCNMTCGYLLLLLLSLLFYFTMAQKKYWLSDTICRTRTTIVGYCWYNIEQVHTPFRSYFAYHRTL